MNPYQNHTDAELVSLLITGDGQAFEMIYRRYISELYSYTRKNISAKEDCEEILQEIFEEIWTRRSELGYVTLLKGYLYRLLRFRVIKYFRRHAVRKKYEEHYRLFEAMYESFREEEIEPDAIQSIIERSLSQLPERCQLAVRLRLKDNLSNDDIAQQMNIKKSTVENYMVTALSHLRTTFHQLNIT